MTEKQYSRAVFTSLVYNEDGEPAEVAYIGQEAHYVIMDGDFRRHVAAEEVDRQVVSWFSEQILANKDLVSESMMTMMGKDDLFTKAMIDSSIKNVDKLMQTGLPDDAKMWLGMMGFKIIVDVHGEVIRIDTPPQDGFDGFGGFGGSGNPDGPEDE